MLLSLYICPTDPEFKELYTAAADAYNSTPYEQRNSGFDLFINADDVTALDSGNVLVGHGCKALAQSKKSSYWPHAFWLVPRSSISKTPWTIANSMGLIDGTYRGEIRAALHCNAPAASIRDWHKIRLTQLATASLIPWEQVLIVDELPGPDTERGEGGFGSSGTT